MSGKESPIEGEERARVIAGRAATATVTAP